MQESYAASKNDTSIPNNNTTAQTLANTFIAEVPVIVPVVIAFSDDEEDDDEGGSDSDGAYEAPYSSFIGYASNGKHPNPDTSDGSIGKKRCFARRGDV